MLAATSAPYSPSEWPHDHVGLEAELASRRRMAFIQRQHGRLGDPVCIRSKLAWLTAFFESSVSMNR